MEAKHASLLQAPCPPPRRETSTADQPSPTWKNLSPDQRQGLLHALGRLVARQLPVVLAGGEVPDEQRN